MSRAPPSGPLGHPWSHLASPSCPAGTQSALRVWLPAQGGGEVESETLFSQTVAGQEGWWSLLLTSPLGPDPRAPEAPCPQVTRRRHLLRPRRAAGPWKRASQSSQRALNRSGSSQVPSNDGVQAAKGPCVSVSHTNCPFPYPHSLPSSSTDSPKWAHLDGGLRRGLGFRESYRIQT